MYSRPSPSKLNLTVAIVGGSGTSKSSGVPIGRKVMPVEIKIGRTTTLDGVPIGSGEGLAEMFMGTHEVTSDDGKKTKKIKIQKWHNALVMVDEGAILKDLGARDNATLDSAMRTAWSGGTLGNMNASEATTRVVKDYCIGIVINLQIEAAKHTSDPSMTNSS